MTPEEWVASATGRLCFSNSLPREIVRIESDGRVVLGEGIQPDEAAKQFWSALKGAAQLIRRAAIAEERKAFAIYLETIGCWHSPKDADEFRALAPDQPIPGWKA